jgi:uncharacterized membrane protein
MGIMTDSAHGQPAAPDSGGIAALDGGDAAALLLALCGGTLLASRRALPRRAANVATAAGLAMLGVAAFPPLAAFVRRAGARRRGAEIRMSMVIDRPVEDVFAFCRDFENYPRFIGSLRGVTDYGDGRSRWCASTPAGNTIEWEAVTTKYVPNRVIAWHTIAGSPVHATGTLRFRPEEGHTCLQILLSYELIDESAMQDALAALISPPRTRQLEADVRKLATYLETALDRESAGR